MKDFIKRLKDKFFRLILHYQTKLIISLLIIEFFSNEKPGYSQVDDSTKKIQHQKIFFLTTLGTGYTGGLFFLNHVWYANQKSSQFHFFNDGREWYYMDKTGHLFFTYQISRAGNRWFRQAGFSEKNC